MKITVVPNQSALISFRTLPEGYYFTLDSDSPDSAGFQPIYMKLSAGAGAYPGSAWWYVVLAGPDAGRTRIISNPDTRVVCRVRSAQFNLE